VVEAQRTTVQRLLVVLAAVETMQLALPAQVLLGKEILVAQAAHSLTVAVAAVQALSELLQDLLLTVATAVQA